VTWSPRPARIALLLAGAALGLSGTLAPAVAAPGVGDTIIVNSASSPLKESGLLTISLTASTTITSLSADLFAAGSDTPSWTVSSFNAPVAGPDGAEVYTASAPIPWGTGAGELPLGDYSIGVNASDQGGTTITDTPAGTLGFLIEPYLTLDHQPGVISWDDRTVTFSGLVSGFFPDGSTGPVPNAVVTIQTPSGLDPVTATTGADGSYSVMTEVMTTQWRATVTGGAGIDTSGLKSAAAGLVITRDLSIATATLATDIGYGKSDTVTGTVTYRSGSAWKPLPDAQVDIQLSQPKKALTVSTDASGNYTATFHDLTRSSEWTITAANNNPFFAPAKTTESVTVNLPTKIADAKMSLSPFGVLAATGCVSFPTDSQFDPQGPVFVDYSAGPKGPWQTLGRMEALGDGAKLKCPGRAQGWSNELNVKLANAWYREQVMAEPGQESSVSKAFHLSKTVTRITGLKVSARSIAKGGSLTVSGTLQQYARGWKSFGSQVVLIILRPKGSKTWYWIKKPHTSANGAFTATFTDPVSADWSAAYNGSPKYFATGAKTIYVKVG
jgi:hypothetical protein